jgi:hypothetical protein
MRSDSAIAHVTLADGNIFVNLGFGPEEAAALLAESELAIRATQSRISAESHRGQQTTLSQSAGQRDQGVSSGG